MSLLSLDWMRTFAIAGREASFAAAARRLNVTPSAVSHQMRALEGRLGTTLFDRVGRSVTLNATGLALLRSIEPALLTIDGAAAKLSDHDATHGPLVIVSSAMFANCFLSHCLPEFIQAFPAIECQTVSRENDAVLDHESADVAVLFGNGRWRDRWSMPLGPVRYAPVCSPRLLSGREHEASGLTELLRHVVVHNDDGSEWRRWVEAAGLQRDWEPRHQLFTNDVSFALSIAAGGGGMTLASDLLANAYLRAGTLVRPFNTSIAVEGTWHVSTRRAKIRMPRSQLFIRWLADRLRLPQPDFDTGGSVSR